MYTQTVEWEFETLVVIVDVVTVSNLVRAQLLSDGCPFCTSIPVRYFLRLLQHLVELQREVGGRTTFASCVKENLNHHLSKQQTAFQSTNRKPDASLNTGVQTASEGTLILSKDL